MAGSLAPQPILVKPLTPEQITRDKNNEVAHRMARLVYEHYGCTQLTDETAQDSLLNRIPANVLAAVVVTESRCNPRAVSPDGASIGLMQIIPYWHHVSRRALLNPSKNLKVGSRFLGECIRKWGIEGGLEHYNASDESRQYAAHVIQVASYGH